MILVTCTEIRGVVDCVLNRELRGDQSAPKDESNEGRRELWTA